MKIAYHPHVLPQDKEMPALFTKCVVGTATEKQREKFRALWQARVKAVLFEEAKGLFKVEES